MGNLREKETDNYVGCDYKYATEEHQNLSTSEYILLPAILVI